MADQTLALEVTLENGQFVVKSKQTEDAVDKVGKKVKKTEGAFKGFNTALKGFMGLAIVTKIVQFGKAALQASMDMENLHISFKTMLGSGKKAKQLLGDIKKFAAATPLQLKGLAENAKLMLNFGVELEDILPNLKMLGDISGGNQEKMGQLTLAFSQMSSAGRLMGQDLLQMINAGFNPLQQISEKTGESIGSLKKKMSAGAISVEMVKGAFKDATSEGGKFFGMMEQQSKTLSGRLSTLKDKIFDVSLAVGDTMAPAFKNLIKAMTGVDGEIGFIESAMVDLGKKTGQVINGLAMIVTNFSLLKVEAELAKKALERFFGGKQTEEEKFLDFARTAQLLQQRKQLIAERTRLAILASGNEDPGPDIDPSDANKKGKNKRKKKRGGGGTTVKGPTFKPATELDLLKALGKDREAELLSAAMEEEKLVKSFGDRKLEIQEAFRKKKLEINDKFDAMERERMQEQVTAVLGMLGNAAGQIGQLLQMQTDAKLQRLDIEEARQIETIQNTVVGVEAQNEAIEALETLNATKRLKIRRKAAKDQKKIAIFETAVAIPPAAFAAYAAAQILGPIAGPIVGGINAALVTSIGLAKLALIKKQPLPAFAEGSFDVKKTQPALVHKGEIITPANMADDIRSGKAALTAGGEGGAGSRIINLAIHIGNKVLFKEIETGIDNREIVVNIDSLVTT